MAKDKKWQTRAQGYNSFQPDRGRTKLSEWYILLYTLLHPFGRPGKSEDIEKDGEEGSSVGFSSSWEMVCIDNKKEPRGSYGKEENKD